MRRTWFFTCFALLFSSAVLGADFHSAFINSYVEQVVLNTQKAKGLNAFGAGWPSLDTYVLPGGANAELTGYSYDADIPESYSFWWHPLHKVANLGNLHACIHYTMSSADTGKVRLRMDFWTVAPGTNLAAVGAVTATTSWTVDPVDTARYYDNNGYSAGHTGAVNGAGLAQLDFSALALTDDRDEIAVSLTRVADDMTNDTHTGEFIIYRVEFHYQMSPHIESMGN